MLTELEEAVVHHNAALQGQVFYAADGSTALILTGDAEGGDLIEVHPDGTTHHALTGVWETGYDA